MLHPEQVQQLADGTKILVKWSGSVDFAPYVFRRDEFGNTFAEYEGHYVAPFENVSATDNRLTLVKLAKSEGRRGE